MLTRLSAGRPDRSTEAEVGRPTCTVRARSQGWWGRSTVQRALLSGNGPGRLTGQPAESSALCIWLRSTGRSTGREPLLSGSRPSRPGGRPAGSTVKNLTVGRSTGRAIRPFSAANGQIFKWVINTPFGVVF